MGGKLLSTDGKGWGILANDRPRTYTSRVGDEELGQISMVGDDLVIGVQLG